MRGFALLLCLCVIACTPKAGDACKGHRCSGSANALACVQGKYVAISCRGPAGCAEGAEGARCDDGIAAENDGCATEGDVACSVDGSASLVCKAGTFVRESACRGPAKCAVRGDRVACDKGIALAGDACTREGNHACAVDGASMLVCQGGAFRLERACGGARGCNVSDAVECDDSVANYGDACGAAGDVACARDKKAMLVCTKGTFTMARACKAHCEVRNREVDCL